MTEEEEHEEEEQKSKNGKKKRRRIGGDVTFLYKNDNEKEKAISTTVHRRLE